MNSTGTFRMKILNTLAAEGCGEALRHGERRNGQTEAAEIHGLWLKLLQSSLEFAPDQAKHVLMPLHWRGRHRFRSPTFALYCHLHIFPFTASTKKGSLSVWMLNWSTMCSLQKMALAGKMVEATYEKCRTLLVCQVSVDIVMVSSQDFFCHRGNATKSSCSFDLVHVRIKLMTPWRFLFLSFNGKWEQHKSLIYDCYVC